MGFKKWIGTILCLIIGLTALSSYINREVNRIKLQQKQLVLQERSLRSLGDLQKEFEQSQLMLTRIDKILIKKEELDGFSGSLESLAKKRLLTIKVELGKETAGNETFPSTLDFGIIATGSYAAITGFLGDLKLSRYFIKLDKLNLLNKGRSFELNTNGEIFFQ